MATIIRAKKDLHNDGKCFTKDQEYKVSKDVTQASGLMEAITTNDQNEQHIIGSWWRHFKIVK
jgi:hypothetical protein